MDMMNLTRIGPGRYEIRFKYKEPLTGHKKHVRRRMEGTLEEARALRDQLKAEARSGGLGEERSSSQTLRSYRSSYANARKMKRGWVATAGTRERDYFVLKDHILPAMGDWILSEITLADLERVVDAWIAKRKSNGAPYAPATINQWIKITRLYVGYCSKIEGIDSPADGLDYLAKSTRKAGIALTGDQVKLFLETMRSTALPWYAMCVLGFGTGLRFSSLSALRWEDVDPAAGVIVVQRSQYRGVEKDGDKMGKIIRIPLLPAFDRALTAHRQRMLKDQHPGFVTGLIFPSRVTDGVQNGFVSASALRRAMRLTCKEVERAGRRKNPRFEFPRITAHDMRRTFITHAYGQQLDPHAIQAAAGHSQDRVSYHYDHVSLDRVSAALADVAMGFGL